jgi:hypothetical protein
MFRQEIKLKQTSCDTASASGISTIPYTSNKSFINIRACRDPLLSSDRELDNETASAARQYFFNAQPLLSNAFAKQHVPTTTNPRVTVPELFETVFSTRSLA